MTINNDLATKLTLIQKVFDINDLLSLQTNKDYIQKYYKANKLAYSLFHTFSDKMYMGISRDGIYKEDDLLEAARMVERYITELDAKHILELATGRGATSAYLARKHPKIEFEGIELSQGQLDFAQKKAKKLNNYHPVLGDYHDLSRYPNNSVDIIFVIEALCYSSEKTIVLKEVRRVLKKNGIFIILDGYIKKIRSKMTKDELLASRLTEIGMAVSEFEGYPSLLDKAKKVGFEIVLSEDVSLFILPTLRKFEKLAMTFFKHPRVARLISKIFSKEFIYNAVSGLLMPNLIEDGLANYYITVLRKIS